MGWDRVSQPSTLRICIWQKASSGQSSIGTVWVFMRRRNSSFRHLMAMAEARFSAFWPDVAATYPLCPWNIWRNSASRLLRSPGAGLILSM